MEKFDNTISAAIRFTEDADSRLKYQAIKAGAELRFRDSLRDTERYLVIHPYDIDGLNLLMLSAAILRDSSTAEKYLPQVQRMTSEDSDAINQIMNNLLFAGLVEAAVAMTRDAVKRFPTHAYIGYQGHRVLLWAGAVDEARSLIEPVRRSEFPLSNVR